MNWYVHADVTVGGVELCVISVNWNLDAVSICVVHVKCMSRYMSIYFIPSMKQHDRKCV